ncbi:SGNH/GDSL hydrolase family protein [Leptospira semungkisensis]|uniref:SGNH/GDSL hydrolase family protein n=1 Tax=Leptospira semungkisensis TaxID=2484985 RepID=A0A4R9G009_9LEPT|nr:SGNH/GDSL hydrolase family protein [Leptospira semungkisensis]TGK03797.1 SGNH/GDSL hydrolase family protein [Leptospira semungkisensis]
MKEIPFYTTSLLLSPVLLWQGLKARKTIPRLPDASGPDFGELPGADPFSLLVLGESTVAGVGIPDYKSSLTGQIASVLGTKSGRKILWKAIGESGITLKEAKEKFGSRLPESSLDAIVIALGANDVVKLNTQKRWSSELQDLIDICKSKYSDTPIFIAGVPPLGIFPSLPSTMRFVLGWKARLLDQASSYLSARLQNVFHIPMRKLGSISSEGIFCSDGFHPSIKGCSIWGEEIADSILAVYNKRFF